MARNTKGKHSKKVEQGSLGLQIENTALYIRVSTQIQVEEGHSLDYQRAKLLEYCTQHDWPVKEEHIYVDAGVSGKSTDRPQFQAMLRASKKGQFRRVIATKLDRIARNLKDLLDIVERLRACKCDLLVLDQNFDTSTPSGNFFLQMMGAIAELERSMIAERVMSGKRHNASEGTFNGAPIPYGYAYQGGVFTVKEEQAAVVRTIFDRFIRCESLNSIATSLNDAGVPSPATKPGKPPKHWTHWGIRHMLDNAFYVGLIEWGDEKNHEGQQPAIVGRETFDKAAAKLVTISKGRPKTRE